MTIYAIPPQYYFRIHHPRPRFKGNLEDVLLFMSSEIAELGERNIDDFIASLNEAIRNFPGNARLKAKTINNWRTEISSLFGFEIANRSEETAEPSAVALNLARSSDLPAFFKFYCYVFQYPGGFLKAHEIKKMIEKGVKFSPVRYVLALFRYADSVGTGFYITKAEATHCIFNDLRVTKSSRSPKETYSLIMSNRASGMAYDLRGDVVRYAGDVLDYMYYANLLKVRAGKYCLNSAERGAVDYIIDHSAKAFFHGYEEFYGRNASVEAINSIQESWFRHISKLADEVKFSTDITSYIGISEEKMASLHTMEVESFARQSGVKPSTKEIGDQGVSLVFGHECERLKRYGRKDLIHKVVILPDRLALGYDLRSYEDEPVMEIPRLIEVKTTISNAEIEFKRFNMTANEWNSAEVQGKAYFVYRLALNRKGSKLLVIRDPVANYRQNRLQMRVVSSGGVEVFASDGCGNQTELLRWSD